MENFGRLTINELATSLKSLKKLEKFIKSKELLNKYYQTGHIKIYSKNNLAIVEVWRLIDQTPTSEYMEKSVKDKITILLKKGGMFYVESWGAYVLN
jgi:hypothetical protein